MPDVVREPGEIDEVWIAAEALTDTSTDLRHLERMRQPRPWSVPVSRPGDLGLVGKSTQRGAVQYARTIAGEGAAVRGILSATVFSHAVDSGCLGRFENESLDVVFGVVAHGH
jgi:hypothetical protein